LILFAFTVPESLDLGALSAKMAECMVHWLAKSSQRSYGAYVRYYLDFCSTFALRPMQTDELTVCLYVTKLAETCSYRTIKSYLNGVRVLHLEAGLTNPLSSFFNVERTLRGIERVKGDVSPHRKLAVTPDILASIIRRLDLFSPANIAFVAAMLVALIFGFFRKVNVCPVKDTATPAEDMSPVRRCDFEFAANDSLVWVNLRRTKTIQFGQRTLRVPLPAIPGSILRPVTILHRLFSVVDAPHAFSFSAQGLLTTRTHRAFVARLKAELPYVGYNPAQFAGHSFRRGGATFAFQCGAPPAQIKEQGDWKAAAYLLYLELTTGPGPRSPLSCQMLFSLPRLGGPPFILPSASARAP
jgi:hypothetical protein